MQQLRDFIDDYRCARAKKHGAGRTRREAVFLALCCRQIRLRKPMAHPMYGRPWRWFFGNAGRFTDETTD